MRYVVGAASFDPNSGSTLFMHRLVHELRALGEDAVLPRVAPPWGCASRED